jgi:hypothetical protein
MRDTVTVVLNCLAALADEHLQVRRMCARVSRTKSACSRSRLMRQTDAELEAVVPPQLRQRL